MHHMMQSGLNYESCSLFKVQLTSNKKSGIIHFGTGSIFYFRQF